MPVGSAAKLASHLWRGAAQTAASAAHNSANTFRGAFHGASSGSGPSSTSSGWASGLSSGAGSAGTGAGGAKYHAGRGAHSTYQQSSRALAQATTNSNNDTDGKTNDDDEETLFQQSLSARLGSSRRDRNLYQNSSAFRLAQVQMQARLAHTFAAHNSPLLLTPTDDTSMSEAAFLGKKPRVLLPKRPTAQKSRVKAREVEVPVQHSKDLNQILQNIQLSGRRGDVVQLRSNLAALDRLPQETPTVAQYNIVMDSLLAVREDGQSVQEIVDVYSNIFKDNLTPNSRTYALIIRALCAFDHDTYDPSNTSKSPTTPFRQALDLLEVAHKVQVYCNDVLAYNALLRSCALRGDADTAIRIVQMLELCRFEHVKFNAFTYKHLIQTFIKDPTCKEGESSADRTERKLNACKQVFEEFQKSSKSEDWDVTQNYIVAGSLLEAHMTLHDSAGAVQLIEKMLENDSEFKGSNRFCMSIMVRGFLDQGDVGSALHWFNKAVSMSQTGATARISTALTEDLIAALSRSPEHVEALSTVLPVYLERAKELLRQPQLSVLRNVLTGVAAHIKKVADQPEQVNAALDKALEATAAFFGSQRPEQVALLAHDQAKQVSDLLTSMLHIAAELIANKRIVDAASSITYAGVFAQHFDIRAPDGKMLAERLTEQGRSFFGLNGLVVSPGLHLLASAEYVAPLLKTTGLLDESFASGLCDLYRRARSESINFMNDLPLSTSAWEITLDALQFEEVNLRPLDTASFQSESIPAFLQDLDKLPDSHPARSTIDVRPAVGIAIARHGGAVIDMMPSWAVERYRNSQSSPAASDVDQTSEAPSSTKQASTAPTSPIPAASPLHRQDLPVSPICEQFPHTFPPVTAVDNDFGQEIMQDMTLADSKNKVNSYHNRIAEKMKKGVFADPEALARCMHASARARRSDKVYELYGMCQHVLSALAQDPAWQTNAWFIVEDLTIQSLGLLDQPSMATVHRHRMLLAGRAPSADAYASLITTIHDTTDDASIAQELFEESRRLGVRPSSYLYNTVISKLSRARKADLALQMFTEMTQLRYCKPTSVTYGAVINACIRTGDLQTAEKVFKRMVDAPYFKAQVPPFNTMMQYYVQSVPDREKALQYYEKMRSFKVKPSAHTYKLLLDIYGTIQPVQADKMEATFKVLCENEMVSVQGTHWASLIHSYGCVLKDLDKAIATFDSIATHPSTIASGADLPDSIAYEALFSVFVAHQRPDLIRGLVEKFKALPIKKTAYVANLIIRGFCMEGEAGLQEARELFESMSEPAVGMAAVGNRGPRAQGAGAPSTEAAVNQSSSAASQERTGSFAEVQREPSTYEAMIRAELGFGHRDRALALVKRMEARAFPPAVIVGALSLVGDGSLASIANEASTESHSAGSSKLFPSTFVPSQTFGHDISRPALTRAYSTQVRHASSASDASINQPAPGPPQPNSPFTIFDRSVKTAQKERAAARRAGPDMVAGEASRQTDYVRRVIAESLADRVQDIKRDFPTIVELGAGPGLLRHYLTDSLGTKKIVMCDTSETLLHRDSHLDSDFAFEFERHVIDEERLPFEENSLDCVVVSGGLHWTNDLPGALIQIRRALKPDGVFIGALCGGDTLFELRTSLQLAEQEREGGISPRISPMADTRDMASLLSRAGFTIPTVDIDEVTIGYPSMYELMHDLRDMGESNAVINRRGFLRRDTMLAASAIYQSLHEIPKDEEEGANETIPEGVPATFQLIFLIGWSPAPTQPKPLKRGSASTSLKDVLDAPTTTAPEDENAQLAQLLRDSKK